MNALEDLLAPYADEIAKFAGAVTCLQFLSGVFLLNDIRRKGSSDTYPPGPILVGVVLTVLSLKLGFLMGDIPMIKVNLIGFFINISFMIVFYRYASNQYKTTIWSKIGMAAGFTMVCLLYSNFEDAEKIEFRLGMLITAILVILVGSPLLNLGDIIKKKSTDGLQFPFILSGTIVAASWMFYGISIGSAMVAYQNLFLLLLSSVQLMLFAIYPNSPGMKSATLSASPSMMANKKSEIMNSNSYTSNDKKQN